MSVFSIIGRLFGRGNSDDEVVDGLDALQDLLESRQATLDLTAEYRRPTVSTAGETTAVFPVTIRHKGDIYASYAKEFVVPNNGLTDTDSPLVRFVAEAHGIDPSDVTFSEVAAIEGLTASADINEGGDIEVGVPNGAEGVEL